MKKNAPIEDTVANVDVVEKLPKNRNLIDRYIHLVALAQQEQLKTEEYTFWRRFRMKKILYR